MIHAMDEIATPIGRMRLAATERGLAYAGTQGERAERFSSWAARRLSESARVDDLPALAAARDQLREYFAGERRNFDIPIDAVGTPFQRAVWSELAAIPFGRTTTYSAIADRVGSPGADRAVGSANGANMIAIIVPCHRVLGSDGALTGYAGGMRTKAKLLKMERGLAAQQRLVV